MEQNTQAPDSTRPAQSQESDYANEGGTAPGGTVAFMGAASQWSASDAASRSNFPKGEPNVDPVTAAKMQHVGLPDESPAEKGDVPVNPGIQPGLFRTARDANYDAPDGEVPTQFKPFTAAAHSQGTRQIGNDPTANDGRFISGGSVVGGKHRGDSPEVIKNPRGAYRP